jgi:hypothetical protein
MAQQLIGIGATPNDGTGDALRVGFDKTNENFADLYSDQGFAIYTDTQYTEASPFVINQGVTSIIPNNAGTVLNTYLPIGVINLYNSTTKKITPQNIGDYYITTIRFNAKNSNASGVFDFFMDLGTVALAQQFKETKVFAKGANSEQSFSIVAPMFSLNNFVPNGGLPKILSLTGNTSLYNISYQIVRIYKAL